MRKELESKPDVLAEYDRLNNQIKQLNTELASVSLKKEEIGSEISELEATASKLPVFGKKQKEVKQALEQKRSERSKYINEEDSLKGKIEGYTVKIEEIINAI